jgi:hypothetical protein
MRDCWKRFEAKLSGNEDQHEEDADEEDEADLWKSAE